MKQIQFLLVAAFMVMSAGMYAKSESEEQDWLIITEICVANIDQTIDYSNNYGGWIELYNPTASPISLDGLFVSDDADLLSKHQLTGYGMLNPGCYQCVFFDHNAADGVYGGQAERQVGFKLDIDGGRIYFSNGVSKKAVCQMSYPPAVSRCSYALTTMDGGEWAYCSQPTPGTENCGPYAQEQWGVPEVDCDSRLFTSSFYVHVDIPDGATLYYTTNGSTPTLSNGSVSEDGMFNISKTTVLRLRLFGDGRLPGNIVTRTYIYKDKDYYLPIVAVSTDPRNLYDNYIGCYVKGKNGVPGRGSDSPSNINMDWERPINFEYLTADGRMVINQEVSFEVAGGYSRHFAPASFKLHAKSVYNGENSYDYPMFAHKPYCKYKQLFIRNGGNNNRTHGGSRIQDAVTQQVVASSGFYLDTQEYQPAHVFINGRYVAMMNVREPTNKYHGCANYGYEKDGMDAFEYSGEYKQKSGTRDAFDHLVALSESAGDDDVYDEVGELLDLDEFINYMAAACYTGSGDWLVNGNNVKGYRTWLDGKFHFVFFDQDLTWDKTDNVSTIDGLTNNEVLRLYNNLKQNSRFRQRFVTAFCILHGSVYAPDRCESIADSICKLVGPALSMDKRFTLGTYTRLKEDMWGEVKRAERINTLENVYQLQDRIDVGVSTNISNARVMIDEMIVPTNAFSGVLFGTVSLSTEAAAGYRFLGWKDHDEQWVSREKSCCISESGDYTAVYEEEFNSELAPICINEVSADNDIYISDYSQRSGWIELYNRSDEPVDLASLRFGNVPATPANYQLDVSPGLNTVLRPGEHAVVWCDERIPISQYHLPFELRNADDCYICVQAEDGSWRDELFYGLHTSKQTVGRFPDGGSDTYVFYHPTIATANLHTSYDVAAGSIPESVGGQIFLSSEIVDISYYNLDGTKTLHPGNGIYIKRIRYRDGHCTSLKVVNSGR
ncbi:MAG: CotH kinase family protein [Bacteroides sp.]|nr:CotH kinase family protein [Roseburia sp.]MCM1346181.1 CotH kinase family protein [Bacteroides sp.]MCM1420682.1 CotH kinase family protein [Bacteroides sp.]